MDNKRFDAPAHGKGIDFSRHILANGLRVILCKNDNIPSVAVNLCYHVGSKNEDPDRRGYAHLFEHLMFEGSQNMEPGEYDSLSLMAGCENNAYTTEDKTNYYILAPSNQLEFALWLESDRMLEFSVTEESLEVQKGVVIEEKKQIFDNRPYGSVSLEFPPLLYPNSCYGWDTIGDDGDIKKATISDIKEFYEKYYVPNNAVLTIAGDIDEVNTLRLAEKYFGSIPAGSGSHKAKFKDVPLKTEIKKDILDEVQLPGIFGAYKLPKEHSREFYIFDIMTDILSTGDSSRLYNELVYKKQLVSDVGCWVEGRELSGILYYYAILMPGVKIETVNSEIDRIFNEVKDGKITARELEKIKNKVETRNTLRMQTNLSRADLLSHYEIFYGNAGLVNTNIDNYMSVTLDDLKEAAAKYIDNSRRVVLNYLPSGGIKK